MAAHMFTMLNQMSESLQNKERQAEECRLIAHAMMYTQQADSMLESLDIYDLASNNYGDTLKKFIDAILPKYESLWKLLNQPRTFEDWHCLQCNLKTRAKGNYYKIYRQSFSMFDFMTNEEKEGYHVVKSE
jgi:hypothetical protein